MKIVYTKILKEIVLIILSVLVLLYVFFPRTFMGRMYIYDFEQLCFEPHYYDAMTYDMFINGSEQDWEQNDNIEWFQTELEGTVIRVSTSYNLDCYFYEDVENAGVLWCTVDGYAKGRIIVGNYYKEYGRLTSVEADAQREAIKTFNSQVYQANRKLIDKMKCRCVLGICLVVIAWIIYLTCVMLRNKFKTKQDKQLE